MRLLLTGGAGMLARDAVRAAQRGGHEVLAPPRSELDVTDEAAVREAVAHAEPQAIINCAAFTDVDGAESKPELAHAVNSDGAANVARAAAVQGVPLVHVSTDYVFDGISPTAADGAPRSYVESDPTGPRTVYGQSKLAGEAAVLGASPRNAVVRTAWLFGVDGRCFPATMLALAEDRDEIKVVTDQTGSPTWTGHLAPALIGLLDRSVRGLVHLAGAGSTSWNGFAAEIFRQADVSCAVLPADSAEMARPAPRPAWSALESEREDVLPLPPWQDGLAGYLAARTGIMR